MNQQQIDTSAYAAPFRTSLRDGKLAKHLMDALVVAYSVGNTLLTDGFRPYRITVQGAVPVIWVEHSPRCRTLCGVVKTVSNLPDEGPTTIMAARVGGAQVQWRVEKKHAN
ncbi:MAG TPA: hypothetical protein DD979_05370 [Gammaproteobacteria bacterium]|jgi:hypothetical protein|nr:hypothetical protein [Gammaproteobacteria bacterium]